MSGPEQAAPSLGDDWDAIAAHAAHHGMIGPAEALASWRALSVPQRVKWRASADAVRMLLDARPARELSERVAELVTEGNELRELVSEVIEITAERDRLRVLASTLDRITTMWTRGMYCAWIDCQRGDVKAAAMCLSEGLDGYDGTRWNGTETGTEWWERTKAEEGLADDVPAFATATEQLTDDHYVIPRGDIDHATRISREASLERAARDTPAVVAAGTEHLAGKIRGLAIGDEEQP